VLAFILESSRITVLENRSPESVDGQLHRRSNSSKTFASWEPGGLHAAFAAVGVAGGDLALQAGRQIFL
jgi:hypothetical protein